MRAGMLLLLAGGLFGCPKRAPEVALPAGPMPPRWFAVDSGKPACVAMGLAPVDAETATAIEGFTAALIGGEPETAQALARVWPEDPGPVRRHARALLGLFLGDAGAAGDLSAVATEYPDDACASAMGALGAAAMGDLNSATAYLQRARSQAPTDPNVAFLSFWVGLEGPLELLPVLQAGLDAAPGEAALQFAVGVARYERGDLEGLALVEQSVEGGMPEGIGLLLPAYRDTKRRGDYLRLAGEVGLLGDDPTVATADDPEVAYREFLGFAENQTLEASFETAAGTFVCTLFPQEAPLAVATFVGLVRGTRQWRDPRDGTVRQGPLYDGTTFHRVIPGFMIQGGDPVGDGSGGPGFRYPDEFDEALSFDRPGRLALANAGPNANGSQFFVTEAPATTLDGRHTIFGDCPKAAAVVAKIAASPRDEDDRPKEPVVLRTITLRPVPVPAKTP